MNKNHSVKHISEFANNDPVHLNANRPWIIFNHHLGSPVHSCKTFTEAMDTSTQWNEDEEVEGQAMCDLDNPSPPIG